MKNIKTNLVAYEPSQGWYFYDLSLINFIETRAGLKYAILNFPFGLTPSDSESPSATIKQATSGNYLFMDSAGNLTIAEASIAKYYV
jgi:hypothetical protein